MRNTEKEAISGVDGNEKGLKRAGAERGEGKTEKVEGEQEKEANKGRSRCAGISFALLETRFLGQNPEQVKKIREKT